MKAASVAGLLSFLGTKGPRGGQNKWQTIGNYMEKIVSWGNKKYCIMVRKVIGNPFTNLYHHICVLFLRILKTALWGIPLSKSSEGRTQKSCLICFRSPNYWIEMLDLNLCIGLHSLCFFYPDTTGLGPVGENSSAKAIFVSFINI